MKPTTSPQCALAVSTTVRPAQLRCICRGLLAACGRPSGRPSGTRAKGERRGLDGGDAPLFQVLSGHGCLCHRTLCSSHRGCKMCNKLSREENPWMVDYRRTMALVGEGLSARRVACGDEGLADLPTQHRWGIPKVLQVWSCHENHHTRHTPQLPASTQHSRALI